MPISGYLGGYGGWDYSGYDFGDVDANETETKEFFANFITFTKPPFTWVLKIILLIGKMGYGKSVFINYFCWLVSNWKGNIGHTNCFRSDDIRIVYDDAYAKLWAMPVQVFVFDDAVDTFDSRDSMKGQNKIGTKVLFKLRHVYGKYSKYGVAFVIFAVQDWSRIDKSIRSTADVVIFENFYDDKYFYESIGGEESELVEFARAFTHKSSGLNQEDQKRFCVGKTMTKETFKWSIPYWFTDSRGNRHRIEDLVNIQHINFAEKINELKSDLKADLFNHEYFEIKTKLQLVGWLRRRADYYGAKDYEINFSTSDLNSIIEYVADLRHPYNQQRIEKFKNDMREELEDKFEVDYEDESMMQMYIKKRAKEEEMFFIKNNDIKEMIKMIKLDRYMDLKKIVPMIKPSEQKKLLDKVCLFLQAKDVATKEEMCEIFNASEQTMRCVIANGIRDGLIAKISDAGEYALFAKYEKGQVKKKLIMDTNG